MKQTGGDGLNVRALLFNSASDEFLIASVERNGPSLQPKQRRLHQRSRLMAAQLAFIAMNHAFAASLQLGADSEETVTVNSQVDAS